MKNPTATQESAIPAHDPRWQLVQRVVSSPEFHKAARLRDFLLHVARCAILEKPEAATEQQVGIHVFGLEPSYDSGNITVVRSQARFLRLKLESYFANTGKDECDTISIPKGTYMPEFRPRIPGQPAGQLEDTPAQPVPARAQPRWSLRFTLALLATSFIVGYAMFLVGENRGHNAAQVGSLQTLAQVLAPGPGQHLDIVVPDYMLNFVRVLKSREGRPVSLEDYTSRRYLDPANLPKAMQSDPAVLRFMISQPATYAHALPVISRVFESISASQISLKNPLEVTTQDFEKDNVMLLGGPSGIPWAQIFEDKLAFKLILATPEGAHIQNMKPAPGEQETYVMDASAYRSYAKLAYIPNLSGKGKILLASGVTGAAIDAASNFAVDPAALKGLFQRFNVATVADLPFFELLMEITERNGAATGIKIIAVRKGNSPGA